MEFIRKLLQTVIFILLGPLLIFIDFVFTRLPLSEAIESYIDLIKYIWN